jgi:DNA-binding transcriptional LysR family regulator
VGDLADMPQRIDHWALFAERYVAVVASSHEFAGLSEIGIEALRQATILNRSNCDVAPKFQQLLFPEPPPHHTYCSGRDLHLQHLATAGFGIVLAPEHMPRLPSLKALPIEGDPVWREVHLLAVQGRCYSPALDAFIKVARLHDWSTHTQSLPQTQHHSRVEATAMSA